MPNSKNIVFSDEVINNRHMLRPTEQQNLTRALLEFEATLPAHLASCHFVVQWDAKNRESTFDEVAGKGVNDVAKRSLFVREVSGKEVFARTYQSGKRKGQTITRSKMGIDKVSRIGNSKVLSWA